MTEASVFVYVRRGPGATLGEPYHQRGLGRSVSRALVRAADRPVVVARRTGYTPA